MDMLDSGDRHVLVRVPGTQKVMEVIFFDGDDMLFERTLNVKEQREVTKSGATRVHGAAHMDTLKDQILHGHGLRSFHSDRLRSMAFRRSSVKRQLHFKQRME